MKPKVYSSLGPRREIHIDTDGQDSLLDFGQVWIKHPNGAILLHRVKSITLEFE